MKPQVTLISTRPISLKTGNAKYNFSHTQESGTHILGAYKPSRKHHPDILSGKVHRKHFCNTKIPKFYTKLSKTPYNMYLWPSGHIFGVTRNYNTQEANLLTNDKRFMDTNR